MSWNHLVGEQSFKAFTLYTPSKEQFCPEICPEQTDAVMCL